MDSTNITNLQLEANHLNSVAIMFIKYFCFLIIPPSVVGHLMSIYVFTRPALRWNPCGMYFLSATIFGLLNASYILPIRLVQSNYSDMDPTVYSSIICKVVWFFAYPIRSAAFWFVALACADRYLCSCTSVFKRSWSTTRVATLVIPLTILTNFLVYIQVPIFFIVDIAPTTNKPVCYSTGPLGLGRTILNYVNLIFFGLGPPLCMLLFGTLTLQHINQSKRIRVAPVNNLETRSNANTQRNAQQIHRMLFVQVLVYSVTGIAFSITLIITTTTSNHTKNVFQAAQGNLANAIVGVISTAGPCLSFYLFTLSSNLFRKELKSLFNRFARIGS